MENNKDNFGQEAMKQNAQRMISGLNGVVQGLSEMTKKTYENMSPEMAKMYAGALENAKIPEHIKNLGSELSSLEKLFKNL